MDDLDIIKSHAPDDWETTYGRAGVLRFLTADEAPMMIVLCADIRASTFLMKEAIKPKYFATAISSYVTSVRNVIRKSTGGWFDKFTGDGFLAYWITAGRDVEEYFSTVLYVAAAVVSTFQDDAIPHLRFNSRNFPERAGISIGIDAGPTHLVEVAGDLTIVGPTVVGAVRMVSAAEPSEIIANVMFGDRLAGKKDVLRACNFEMERIVRPTKEYDKGQQMYRLSHRPPA